MESNEDIIYSIANYPNENHILLKLNEQNKNNDYPVILGVCNNNKGIVKSLLGYAEKNDITL